jgi:aldehyde oxidoreductase
MKSVSDHSDITTIEGIGTPTNLHPLQKAMIMTGGVQCGICSPGFIVSGKALLDANPNPTRQEVREWFQKHHNLCRCTGYKQIVDAVMAAAKVLRGEITMEDLDFKMPANGSLLGTMYPRPAALAKVTGTCDYGTDINEKMPAGSVYHMGLAQAKVSHAKVLKIDVSKAEKMPGVVKVVTRKDVMGNNRIFSGTMGPRITMDGFDRRIFVRTRYTSTARSTLSYWRIQGQTPGPPPKRSRPIWNRFRNI